MLKAFKRSVWRRTGVIVEIVRDGEPQKSSGFAASFMWAFIITIVALIFAMFGYYNLTILPSFSNWMGDFFLANGETAFYKFGGLWLLLFILFMTAKAVGRQGGSRP